MFTSGSCTLSDLPLSVCSSTCSSSCLLYTYPMFLIGFCLHFSSWRCFCTSVVTKSAQLQWSQSSVSTRVLFSRMRPPVPSLALISQTLYCNPGKQKKDWGICHQSLLVSFKYSKHLAKFNESLILWDIGRLYHTVKTPPQSPNHFQGNFDHPPSDMKYCISHQLATRNFCKVPNQWKMYFSLHCFSTAHSLMGSCFLLQHWY